MLVGMARTATRTDVFNAIGDPARRALLDELARGEATVGDLAHRLGRPQPQVSKHLAVLRDVDAVRCRSHGRHRVYAIHPAGLAPLTGWLARLTADVNAHLDRLDDYLHELATDPADEPAPSTDAPTRSTDDPARSTDEPTNEPTDEPTDEPTNDPKER